MADTTVSPFAAAAAKPCLCVVVSFYDARPADELLALLGQLQRLAALPAARRWPFALKVVVSVNAAQGAHTSLVLPQALAQGVTLISQRNQGYNMGAWEHGWRHHSDARHYLFLQDECRLMRDDALLRYWTLLERWPRGALVGESLQRWPGWGRYRRTWPVGCAAVERMASEQHIPLGASASHLQTLAVGASAASLQRMNGFLLADEKLAAIATEVLLSRRALGLGMRVVQAGWRPFEYFGHEQWSAERERSARPRWWLMRLAWGLLPL